MGKIIKRNLLDAIWKDVSRKEYQAIVGPRQAGKTTLLRLLQEKLLDQTSINSNEVRFVTFQDPIELEDFETNPKSYVNSKFAASDRKKYLLIDEFQYAKNAGASLKLIYDTQENLKIIISGSSSLELKDIASNMVGRIFQYYLGQLSFSEILRDKEVPVVKKYDYFQEILSALITEKNVAKLLPSVLESEKSHLVSTFEDVAVYGSYPAVYKASSDEEKQRILLNIYNTYVEKDIVKLLQIGSNEKFLNFIQYLSLTIGTPLNLSNAQSELGLRYREVMEFLDSLKSTYIINKVSPYSTSKINELKKSPIYYFVDTGLRNWSIKNFSNLDIRIDKGHLIENIVYKKLQNLENKIFELNKIAFWRKKSGAEVDFVLEVLGNNPHVVPVEVKYSNLSSPKVSKSFHSFIKAYKPDTGLIVTKDYFDSIEISGTKILFLPAYVL